MKLKEKVQNNNNKEWMNKLIIYIHFSFKIQ